MKKSILIIALLLVCVNIGILLGYLFTAKIGNTTTKSHDRQTACGPLCLRIAANLYGIPCDESHALAICPPAADGTRLGDLSKAAARLGMKANIAKLIWEKLLNLHEFAILHVNGNHYVLASPNEQNGDAFVFTILTSVPGGMIKNHLRLFGKELRLS